MGMKKNVQKPVVSTALLKIKCIHHPINPESVSFEELIMSSNTSVKIDFPDGKSLMEKGFRSHTVLIDKFYVEFFEEFDLENMLDYLVDEDSDFRVTSLDGSVIRLSHDDYQAIPRELIDDSKKPLKEFVFKEEGETFFQKIKRAIHGKDN